MSVRKLRLEKALDRVLRAMNLRRPQKDSLQNVHKIVLHLDRDLPELAPAELIEKVRELHPDWSFPNGFVETTADLATGVGKTRLMGAIAAYLYLGKQSETFLFLAPRTAILRKLKSEALTGSPKYLFGDSGVVPDPRLCHADNLTTFRAEPQPELFGRGPNVFIFSPQSIAGDDRRFSRPSEFSGAGPEAFLAARNDLVAFMDESHHLGHSGDANEREWVKAIVKLGPKLLFGMTATPPMEGISLAAGQGGKRKPRRPLVNVLHRYDLAQCLRERLYTKDVNLIVDKRPSGVVVDDDWDHHTLDFALDRLKKKEIACNNYSGETQFPSISPVLLICAEDTKHADAVAEWLKSSRGLTDAQLLVTHSGRTKSDDEIERLVTIERPDSRVRVVVNVQELTEGWDVTNVYVIAPLRTMGTFTGAVQTLGRGLRLPAGRRVGDSELDSLDVLCFGKAKLEDILKEAKGQFGGVDEIGDGLPINVTTKDDEEFHREPATKSITIGCRRPISLALPKVTRVPAEPELDFEVITRKRGSERTASAFRLGDDDISGTAESLKFDFSVVVGLAAGRILEELRYLSEPLHRSKVETLVSGYLKGLGKKESDPISLDWILVAKAVEEEIDKPYRKMPVTVRLDAGQDNIEFGTHSWRVPESFAGPAVLSGVTEWNSRCFRIPIAGWKRCVHEAAAFETKPEWLVARILDASPKVKWWVRNDPVKFRLSSPIGFFEPDFVAEIEGQGDAFHLVLETKQEGLWQPEDSDARVKSRAASAWCEGVSEASGERWEHWVLLEPDVLDANSLADLRSRRIGGIEIGDSRGE